MSITNTILLPEHYYHIYNHGNADDNIFRTEENYIYFLNRYAFFINSVADTLAYCLLPNHFHFIIQIKKEEEVNEIYKNKKPGAGKLKSEASSDFINQQFSNLFNAYSKAFNKMYNRNGKLFRLPFKRKLLDTDAYLLKAIHYVHSNPVHHGFVKDMHDWNYSSIHAYESQRRSAVKKEKILELFGGLDQFRKYHQQPVDLKYKIEMDF
ncbi:MAG: transposase [Parafilimonas sp.]